MHGLKGEKGHIVFIFALVTLPPFLPPLVCSSLHCSLSNLSLLLGWRPNHLLLLIGDFVTRSLLISLISFFPLPLYCGTVLLQTQFPNCPRCVYPCPGHLCPDFLVSVCTHPLNLNLGVTICRSLPWPFVTKPDRCPSYVLLWHQSVCCILWLYSCLLVALCGSPAL